MEHDEIWYFPQKSEDLAILEEDIKQGKTWNVWQIAGISNVKTGKWKEEIYRQRKTVYPYAQRLWAYIVQGNVIEHRVQETWWWEIGWRCGEGHSLNIGNFLKTTPLNNFTPFASVCVVPKSSYLGDSEGPEPMCVGISKKWEPPNWTKEHSACLSGYFSWCWN